MIIVTKPAGLLSVPGKAPGAGDCLESRLRHQIPEALLVHRLDMDTSGLMVFAANRAAQRHLGLQFEKRHVDKTYVADVEGQIGADTGTVTLPLICDWPNRPLQMVCHDRGKHAETRWQVIGGGVDWTRLELFPKTGRSHQLRVHMQAIGHPILGDRFYGDHTRAPRLHLHAAALGFYHPSDGRRVTFQDPAPF